MGVKNSDWLSIDQSLHRVIDQLSQCTVRFAWFMIHILRILTILTYISLEKAMAPHSSTLAWKIPWAEDRLQSMGSLRVGHDWATLLSFSLSCIGEGNGNPLQCSCLENPRTGEPGGLPSMGSHKVGHDWSNLGAVAAWDFKSPPPFL